VCANFYRQLAFNVHLSPFEVGGRGGRLRTLLGPTSWTFSAAASLLFSCSGVAFSSLLRSQHCCLFAAIISPMLICPELPLRVVLAPFIFIYSPLPAQGMSKTHGKLSMLAVQWRPDEASSDHQSL